MNQIAFLFYIEGYLNLISNLSLYERISINWRTILKMNNNKKHLLITALVTLTSFVVSFICLTKGIYVIYQNLFYIPIICSCFWYQKKGLVFSVFIGTVHYLYFLSCNPEPLWDELIRLFVFIIMGHITCRLSLSIEKQQIKILQLNRKLQNDVERFNKAEALSKLGSYEANVKTGKVVWSDELYRIFGFEPKSFEPDMTTRLNLSYPDDKMLVEDSIKKVLVDKLSFNIENRIVRQDGSIRWVLSTGHVELDDNGEVESYVGTLLDITERRNLEKHLENEKEKLAITLASIGDGVISTDTNGNVTLLNHVAENLTGWTQEEAFGLPIETVFYIINEKTREKCENPIKKVIESGMILGLANHTALISKDGVEKSIADSVAPIKDRDGEIHGAILVFRDVTEEKRRQNEIYYMSYYDSLTGLYNRRYFEDAFKRLDTARNLPISIIVGDTNGLKLINDTFGHKKGDKLLVAAANAIKKACRSEDIAARWGGDEFIILLPKTSQKDAEGIVKRIKDMCAKVKIGTLSVSVSLGYSTKEVKSEDLSKILENAEDYMYKHKVSESGRIRANIIDRIFNALCEKNPRIEGHSKRVSQLCHETGLAMKLSEKEIDKLKISGLFHDIGKITIDNRIITKPDTLTQEEWIEMKRHPDIGFKILNTSPDMTDIAQNVLCHHERVDGTGYPRGITKDRIPLISRIIAVADAYDAMTNERPYKKSLSKDKAAIELEENKGTQFDSEIVDIFIKKVLKQ